MDDELLDGPPYMVHSKDLTISQWPSDLPLKQRILVSFEMRRYNWVEVNKETYDKMKEELFKQDAVTLSWGEIPALYDLGVDE